MEIPERNDWYFVVYNGVSWAERLGNGPFAGYILVMRVSKFQKEMHVAAFACGATARADKEKAKEICKSFGADTNRNQGTTSEPR